jgi:5-(carboxyamino)imidazole ribonucleotide synthase
MLALAGYPLGLQFRFFDPDPSAPSAALGEHIVAPYDDLDALTAFARDLDVVTYEFENVPVAAAEHVASLGVPVWPPPAALRAAQDRLVEKRFLRDAGFETAPFAAVDAAADLAAALATIGLPAVLKTRRMGYDGKGQRVVRAGDDPAAAVAELGGRELIVEGWAPFQRELSLIAARGLDGNIVMYPLVQNRHAGGILRETRAPALDVSDAARAAAEVGMRAVMDRLDYVGVLAIELFDVGGQLLANEMAPRVHNSGHWTIEGAATSQFANHLRAVVGLPLGAMTPRGHVAMLNLLGDLPDIARVLQDDGACLHLYGKTPRPGRKLGHVTLLDDELARLDARVQHVRTLAPDA